MEPTPSDELRVRYRPTAQDHLALYRLQVGSNPAYRIARLGVTVLAVLLIAVVLIPRGVAGMVGTGVVALGIIGLWVIGPAMAQRRISRLYGPGSEPPEVEYRLDARGVHGSAAWAEWGDVARADETAEAFVLAMRHGAGAYLPKREIAGEDLAPLRTLLKSNLGGRARLRTD
jgi:hypothetical protein